MPDNYSKNDAEIQQYRTPPAAKEAEDAVLGALLLDNKVFDLIGGRIDVEDFYDYGNRLIFENIKKLIKKVSGRFYKMKETDIKELEIEILEEIIRNEELKIMSDLLSKQEYTDISKLSAVKNVALNENDDKSIYEKYISQNLDYFIENYSENSLDKILECQNKYFEVSILDSTFVNDEEDDDNFSSYYSAVQGIVLVFQIDLLSSEFMNEINHFYS